MCVCAHVLHVSVYAFLLVCSFLNWERFVALAMKITVHIEEDGLTFYNLSCLDRCLCCFSVTSLNCHIDLHKLDGLPSPQGCAACSANDSACWRNKVAADTAPILFWQVDYCCNNIRLVLVMQTASTHCSLARARLYIVFWSLWTCMDTGVQASQASHPSPLTLFSLISFPPHISALPSQLLLVLPP